MEVVPQPKKHSNQNHSNPILIYIRKCNKRFIRGTQDGTKGYKGIKRQSHNLFMNGHTHLISASYLLNLTLREKVK